jgi:uncharacterized membrane protein
VRSARTLFTGVAVSYAVTWLWVEGRLPARVPTHFGAGGRVDTWSSRGAAAVSLGVLGLGVTLAFVALVALVQRVPRPFVNIPNADYWTRPEHRAQLRRLVADDLWLFGAWTLLLLVAVQLLILHAAQLAQPSVQPWAPVLLVVYLAGLAARGGWMYRGRYAIPRCE